MPVRDLLAVRWLLLVAIAGWVAPAEAAEPPNVVLILIDDLGATDLGCYGGQYYRTPNLDRMAAEGLRFTQAYAACPVCSPTRAALLTGKYPARLHLTDYIPGHFDRKQDRLLRPDFLQQLPLEEVTLAERSRAAGYATAAIGKWHLGDQGYEPGRQGFDVAAGGIAAGSVPSHFAPYLRGGRQLPGLEAAPDGEYLADRLTSEAEKFLTDSAGKPFFLYLSHYAVHTPLMGPAELVSRYEAAQPHGLQRNAVYAAMVENMDHSVGRILRKLDELKVSDNTLVIFTSDNGGLATSGNPTKMPATNNAPLREGKGYLYEGGIRVPLLIRWPRQIKAGTTSATPTSSIDLTPSVCDACAVAMPEKIDGLSLRPLWQGAAPPPREALYWHYPHYSPQGGKPGGAIRQGDLKLIEFYEQGRIELFNLADDPSESTNLVDRLPQQAAELSARLAAWRAAVDAHLLTPNPDFQPDTQADDGVVTLPAGTAQVHGVMLRYEPLPHKNTLGFWVRAEDWASWDFRLLKPGDYEIEILQGCGPGSGGSQVELSIGQQRLTATVAETGGFQDFVARKVGTVKLTEAGAHTLSVKPRSKPGAAVMDLRQVRLLPAPPK